MKAMHNLTWTAATLVLALAASPATAQQSVAVESGGASVESFDALTARASDYSLKLLLAAKGSGAYLADVDVTVRALPSNDLVLQHRTEGPLMLAALPSGRYRIETHYSDVLPGAATTIQRTVVVPRNGRRNVVIYFDTGDNVAQ
jgi:hypothetical protein